MTLLYLVASVFFIQALKGLSHPTTSIRGNRFGMAGMTIAVLTTAALILKLSAGNALGLGYVLLGLPAALAAALFQLNPEQMQLLFREQMGQMMLATAVVMQIVGFFWIRQVIKIEV